MVVLIGRGGSLADADASYQRGLVVLAGGPAAPTSRAFQHGAATVAAVAVIALVLLVGAIALCLLVVLGAGLALQGSALNPRIAFAFAPDVTTTVALTAATLTIRALATLWWARHDKLALNESRR